MIKIETWAVLEALAEKADFLDGVFKVFMRLVDMTKFPIFFNDFYLNGEVPVEKLKTLLIEVEEIEKQLKKIEASKSYVDNEPDFLKVPNTESFLNKTSSNMADYFLTPNRENMLEVFKFNIGYAIEKETPVRIKYYIV
jgi:hypothetical protein